MGGMEWCKPADIHFFVNYFSKGRTDGRTCRMDEVAGNCTRSRRRSCRCPHPPLCCDCCRAGGHVLRIRSIREKVFDKWIKASLDVSQSLCDTESLVAIQQESGRTVDPIYDKSEKLLALLMGGLSNNNPESMETWTFRWHFVLLFSGVAAVRGAQSIAVQFHYNSVLEIDHRSDERRRTRHDEEVIRRRGGEVD